MPLLSIYLGDRLGWYRSLLRDVPATGEQLAERTGTNPRYAREWLEQQAVTWQGASIAYAVFLLAAAAALSLAAQLAVAQPTISGWLLSSVPALAFMALSKLVLSGKVEPESQPTEKPAAVRPVAPVRVAPAIAATAPSTRQEVTVKLTDEPVNGDGDDPPGA